MHTNSKCNSDSPPAEPVKGGGEGGMFFLFKPMNEPRQPARVKKMQKVCLYEDGKKRKREVRWKNSFCVRG